VTESTALDGLELLVEGNRQLTETGPDGGTVWNEDASSISDGQQSLVLCADG
jgi:hypothetical protein